jgi:hypothetical protein
MSVFRAGMLGGKGCTTDYWKEENLGREKETRKKS